MYNFSKIEEKWNKYWKDNNTFKTDVWDFSKPKYYVLDMFPYPSGVGLHAGHVEGYTATDIVSRMKRMQGYNVLHPMGYDSFGLPAEQYAVKTGNNPNGFTEKNINTFTKQLYMLGFDYDWSKMIKTSDPDFYKWTQWIFKQLYLDGYAKRIDMPVNWCEELGTVLSNDEVIDGKSERGGYPVVRRNMKQWVIDQTAFAEKLLSGLDELDWPESTKEMERNWIGKSVGAHVKFKIKDTDKDFTVFTTRADTLFGATYCVMSPEHELVDIITTPDKLEEVKEYKKVCATKSDLERTELNKEKTGVFIGRYAINPINNKEIPIYISDYVLASYGTGAIMAVPAHDQRDYEFAKKFNIPIIQVLEEEVGEKHDNEVKKSGSLLVFHDRETDKYAFVIEENDKAREGTKGFTISYHTVDKDKNVVMDITPYLLEEKQDITSTLYHSKEEIFEQPDSLYSIALKSLLEPSAMTNDGIHINSSFLDGLNKEEAINKVIDYLEENNCGTKKINYRLREWIFARQRYWGEPVPVVYLENDEIHILDDDELPLILPELEDYKGKNGKAPLENATDWKKYNHKGLTGVRETSTMPGSAGSSWYYLRYIDPHNDKELANKELLKHWMPVDLYIGGPEHAVGHLIYSRIWNHYLYDKGLSPVKEPFKKLVHQGMLLGSNGIKMGKRYPEYAIDPLDIVKNYGADTLRLYEMFMGPLEASKPWNNNGVEGAQKFLDRVYRLYESDKLVDKENKNLEKIYHQTVKKVTLDFESLNFNTAISQMMIFINAVYKEDAFPLEYAEGFVKLLNPVAPHMTEELWEKLGHNTTIAYETWPCYDDAKLKDDTVTIVVQVNGKVRGKMDVDSSISKEDMESKAFTIDNVKEFTKDREVVKVITVPKKLINIVVK